MSRGLDPDHVAQIETKFGNFLYLPLDLPSITAEGIRQYFIERSKPICKLQYDVAGAPHKTQIFNSIDFTFKKSIPRGGIWETNFEPELLRELPELIPFLEALPFYELPDFMLWSSNMQVQPHRDSAPWLDCPSSIRSFLLDENPTQTLKLQEAPSNDQYYFPSFLPLAKSGHFAWNNLRAKHSSTYSRTEQYKKILLIVSSIMPFDLVKLENLLDRSVAKYRENALCSVLEQSDFVDG